MWVNKIVTIILRRNPNSLLWLRLSQSHLVHF